ncbi:uncharacterized protein V1513DRAFT_426972 [Lipomyces chichibuensis]|uniref:uncharacterized protein n=1 Tax=Lipomyces chichibuensis TaxID=1546026 RepID=UPI00334335D9
MTMYQMMKTPTTRILMTMILTTRTNLTILSGNFFPDWGSDTLRTMIHPVIKHFDLYTSLTRYIIAKHDSSLQLLTNFTFGVAMDALAKDVLHLPDNYNSDDEEFSDGERTVHKQGFANCQELFKNALENRRTTNQSVSLQSFSQDTESAGRRYPTPTGEHIYRFIDTISRTIKTRYRGKQVPSLHTIKGGLKHLSATLSEIYEDFTISTQKSIQSTGLDSLTLLDNDFDDLSDEILNEQQAAEADLLADIICARERIASDATLQNDDSETVLEDLLLDSLEQGPRFDANDAIHLPFVKFIEFFSKNQCYQEQECLPA